VSSNLTHAVEAHVPWCLVNGESRHRGDRCTLHVRTISAQTRLAAGATLLAIAWAVWLGRPDFPLDDSYILQHAVDGVLRGREDRFIGSTPLQGVTSPASLLPMAALGLLLPTPWTQVVVTALAAVLYLVGVYRLGTVAGLGNGWSVSLALLALLAGRNVIQLLNGLETGLAMAAVTWLLVWFRDAEPDRRWHYALVGLLPFIRPELAALSVLVLLRACWSLRRRDTLRSLATSAAWVAVGAAPVVLFLVASGGAVLPNTVSAKAFFFAEGCLPLHDRLTRVWQAGGAFLDGLGLASLGFFALPLSRAGSLGMAFIPLFLLAYTLRLPGALFHNEYRYFHVLVPFAMAGWAAFATRPAVVDRSLSRALLLVAMAMAAATVRPAWARYVELVEFSRIELAGVTDWVTAHVPAKDVIMVHDAGYISLRGSQPLIDLVGLKSPSSVEAHRRYTWTACRRDPRALDVIARASEAKYLVVLDDWDRIFELSAGLRRAGWSVLRADRERGATRYTVYRIAHPGPDVSAVRLTR
jgi:hypothetical protein